MSVNTQAIPLGFLGPGRSGTMKGTAGGVGLRRRLSDMGVTPGSKIKVIKNDSLGPLIISVGDTRLAIGRGMALQISVEETG